MNQASQLFQLQKIDTEIDQIRSRMNEIARLLASDMSVRTAEEQLEHAKRSHYKAQQALRSIEETVKTVRIKINTSESSLYGGKIRNPKELQDLQVETASLKRRLGALEDEQLEAMLGVDQAENEQKSAEENLLAAQASFATRQAGLLGEQGQLQKRLERLQSERGATSGSILPENLEIYERLRKSKRGLAVVTMTEDETCTGCGSTIRPAERQAARAQQQMTHCSTCSRILYAG